MAGDESDSFEVQEAYRVPTPTPSGELVSADIKLTLKGFKLQTKVPVSKGPTTLSQMMPIFHAFTDAIMHGAVQNAKTAGQTVSCKPGCAACCRQLIPVTTPEAYRLAAMVEAMPEPQRTKMKTRFAAAREKVSNAGLADDTGMIARVDANGREQWERYMDLWIDCPFLEQEKCTIYASRPMVCREYLVTNDPAHCKRPSPEVISTIGLPGSMSVSVARAAGRVQVALVDALEFARREPEPAAVFNGPELLRRVMGELTGRDASAIPAQKPGPKFEQ